jgi:hypothetical protein
MISVRPARRRYNSSTFLLDSAAAIASNQAGLCFFVPTTLPFGDISDGMAILPARFGMHIHRETPIKPDSRMLAARSGTNLREGWIDPGKLG